MSYSSEFMSELPIKYLLQQAQKDQGNYAGEKINSVIFCKHELCIKNVDPLGSLQIL